MIHNHIIGVDPTDYIMEATINLVESSGGELETCSCRDSTKESKVWNIKRDEICQAMWSVYTRIGK